MGRPPPGAALVPAERFAPRKTNPKTRTKPRTPRDPISASPPTAAAAARDWVKVPWFERSIKPR
jgi:hypothetical protein